MKKPKNNFLCTSRTPLAHYAINMDTFLRCTRSTPTHIVKEKAKKTSWSTRKFTLVLNSIQKV